MMLRALLITTAIALLSAQATAATVTPASGSDQIRAARSLATQDAITFAYDRTVAETGKADQKESGKVTLARDFAAVERATDAVIDDFALCRTLTWQTGKPGLDNQSCYLGPGFRLAELANRRGQYAMLSQALGDKVKADAMPALAQPYWAEQELAMQSDTSSPLIATNTAAATEWRLGDRVVVRVSRKGTPFAAGDAHLIARYFARNVDLHPQVRSAIVASGMLPDEIVIQRMITPTGSTETFHYSGMSRKPAGYPLPPALTSTLLDRSQGASREAVGLRQTLATANGTSHVARPSLDDLVLRIQAAADGHRMPEALMLFYQVTQQYGGVLKPGSAEMAKVRAIGASIQAVYQAPENARFAEASELAGGDARAPSLEPSAAYLAQARDLDALPFGTFRYVTFANLVRQANDVDKWDKAVLSAMPALSDCYWTHIAAYPWSANAFKDLGDTYYGNFALDKAWQAWDLGRAVDSGWKASAMGSIGDYEDRLRTLAPDSF